MTTPPGPFATGSSKVPVGATTTAPASPPAAPTAAGTIPGAPAVAPPAAADAAVLGLALVGSRAPGFHHDLASKLQGLMMALDELSELPETSASDPQRCVTSAQQALREALTLLNANRALTKPPVPAATPLASILQSSADRARVTLRGVATDARVMIGGPAILQALSLLLDACAGPGRARSLDVTIAIDGDRAVISVPILTKPVAAESVTIASFAITRDGGSLEVTDRAVIRLPLVG